MPFFTPETIATGRPKTPLIAQCGKCQLYKNCHSPKMPPSGNGKHTILFVGESPGATEDSKGTQFVGKTGQRLRSVLLSLGVKLNDCHVTNAVICRPPDNKTEDKHVDFCRPNLLRTIRERKPTVIVLLGALAVKSLISTERTDSIGSITRWVGWTIPSHTCNAWICPTYHPSYIERMDNLVLDRIFRDHLKQAIALEHTAIATPSLAELRSKVDIVLSPHQALLRMKELAKKKGTLAFDYETNARKPDSTKSKLISVSFCLNGEDTWACMLDGDTIRALAAVLENPSLLKVNHNMKFELRWSYAKVTKKVRGLHWCSMNNSHILDNRKDITGLKFQSYVNFGISDYEVGAKAYMKEGKDGLNRVAEMPPRELLTYGGMDSLLTHMLYRKQRKQMGCFND